MKKISLISLICLYALSTLGIGLKQFYCNGKLKSAYFSFEQTESKEKVSKCDKADCCKSKILHFKLKDSHAAATQFAGTNKYSKILSLNTSIIEFWPLANKPDNGTKLINAPPLQFFVPLYIYFCNYRI